MSRKIIIFSTCIALLAAIIGLYFYVHPTHFAFNDRNVLGKSVSAITERYGKFDRDNCNINGEIVCGEYKIREDTPELIMGYDNSLWYVINFEEGVAVSVALRKGTPAG